jgi:hypothetical protein
MDLRENYEIRVDEDGEKIFLEAGNEIQNRKYLTIILKVDHETLLAYVIAYVMHPILLCHFDSIDY